VKGFKLWIHLPTGLALSMLPGVKEGVRLTWFLAAFFVAILTSGARAAAIDFEPNIPVVFVETPKPLQIGRVEKGSVRVVYPKGNQEHDTEKLAAELKYRGAVSLSYEKKSMAFELDSEKALAGMPERTHWILNAAFVDRSMMRHKLAYDLYAKMSEAGAPRFAAGSRFVEVFQNGDYRGAYLLTERVDRKLLKLRKFNKADEHHACIYKVIDHTPVFDMNGHSNYEQHEPNPRTNSYWAPLDEINRFCHSASESAFWDANTGIATRVDLADAIDFHLHLLMVSNTDGPDKNFIVARDGVQKGKAPRFFFVPWDCDATFGRAWHGGRDGYQHWQSNHLFDRLLKDASYRKQFVTRWRLLRHKQFSTAAIHTMIDENVKELGAAAQRNAKRWGQSKRGDPPNFEQDLAEMKDWVAKRGAWLDSRIEGMSR
jgi:spore coat protein H